MMLVFHTTAVTLHCPPSPAAVVDLTPAPSAVCQTGSRQFLDKLIKGIKPTIFFSHFQFHFVWHSLSISFTFNTSPFSTKSTEISMYLQALNRARFSTD